MAASLQDIRAARQEGEGTAASNLAQVGTAKVMGVSPAAKEAPMEQAEAVGEIDMAPGTRAVEVGAIAPEEEAAAAAR